MGNAWPDVLLNVHNLRLAGHYCHLRPVNIWIFCKQSLLLFMFFVFFKLHLLFLLANLRCIHLWWFHFWLCSWLNFSLVLSLVYWFFRAFWYKLRSQHDIRRQNNFNIFFSCFFKEATEERSKLLIIFILLIHSLTSLDSAKSNSERAQSRDCNLTTKDDLPRIVQQRVCK
jgi:hypothetical protein